ncbi:polysaccharide lyase family 8 super-sandwich domain-containing protein [Porifericola rhodea]|uniref:polysaccharide lyase family 8 super-sandwich domain-containing protein n=1 Tax=Porifericola rhodea TaxID=930972 RepID=UPI00266566E2|nr:polysaccharide lyase family 8 super-sandwich domain-containing protein [Porifericola rhodea]WKN32958.1 polysaccharide lyase family 8 super-sandwich domain-containing protein [Porifericola rhodea]
MSLYPSTTYLLLLSLFLPFHINAQAYSGPSHFFSQEQAIVLKEQAEQSSQEGLEVLRKKVIAELMEKKVNDNQITSLMSTQQKDGRWPGINYQDVSRTGFEHSIHLENMILLSRAYKSSSSQYFQDTKLKQAFDQAFQFWVQHDFICDNWWWNQIGTPDRLLASMLIMDESLSEEQKNKAAPIVGRATLDAWGARPGGDLIKIAGIWGKYALFTRDSATLNLVVKTMASEIAFAADRNTPEDRRGLQTDMSFHHRHDRVTSTLSYGLGYAKAFADWAAKVAGTEYRFPEDKIKLLVDFYLDGICKTTVYGKYPDPGAKNRSLSRKGTLWAYTDQLPAKLLQATDYRKDELKEIIQIRSGEVKPRLKFNRFYWHTEYLSHQRPNYFTSVRMHSSRNHTMEEPYNGEGLRNHHLGDGSNFISRTGQEYTNIFPVWDWQKIPGTTVVQKPALPSEKEIQKKGKTDFVGAVTDGTYGLAAFDFKSAHDALAAKKVWFFFDQEYISLGAGIQSAEKYPVVTTLNQCLLKGDVLLMDNRQVKKIAHGQHQLNKVSGVWHDSIAYYFLSPASVNLSKQTASGNWRLINHQSTYTDQEIRKDVFKLWLEHGSKPNDATYAYIVVPALSSESFKTYAKALPLEVLANTPQIQAVRHSELGITQLVFYQPGSLQLSKNMNITVPQAAIVMLQTEGDFVKKISVSDPTRKLQKISISLSSKIEGSHENISAQWDENSRQTQIEFDLPQGEYAGQSVSMLPESLGK